MVTGDIPVRSRETTKVLVADRRELFRQALAAWLRKQSGIKVVGTCATGPQIIESVRELAPDTVIIDTEIEDCGCVKVIRQVVQLAPNVAVMILTHSKDEKLILAGIKAGAKAYLSKDASVEELLRTISGIKAGYVCISAPLTSIMLNELGNPDEELTSTEPDVKLTAREREVLQLIADGFSNREIGESLGISSHTAKVHVYNVMEKLRVHSRLAVATWVMRSGGNTRRN